MNDFGSQSDSYRFAAATSQMDAVADLFLYFCLFVNGFTELDSLCFEVRS
jgi:hypothetical protein